MSGPDIREFVADRNNAFLSLDLVRINAMAKKYGAPQIPDTIAGWGAVHKARTAITAFPEEEREKSRRWLAEHHMKALG
jgi:hypothetical protein